MKGYAVKTNRPPLQALICLAIAALCAASATAQLAATPGSTNVVIVSQTIEEPAWRRHVVMQDGATGEIMNDEGTVGSAAETAAAGAAAEHAADISDAANVAMTNALRVLTDASANAATNAVALALVIMPETSRTNLTAYVVKTETDGTNDTQWVWWNYDISLPPNRFVVYQTHDHATTNKVTWTDWTNAVTVTHNGRTWEGCRVCTVARPAWARGGACLDLPNDRLGGPSGFDFGDLLLTMDGAPLYTGFVTNGVTGAVLYFDNGFNKGEPQ